MPEPLSAVCAGYMPLDVIDDGIVVWRRAGGTAGNVAAILAFFGWDAAIAGRAGDDRAGDELIRDLTRAGVDCGLIDRELGALTTRLLHLITPNGHHYAYTCRNCGQKLPRSRPLTHERLERVVEGRPCPGVYFFDRANPATVALAERYANAGSLVVYEPSTPASTGLLQRAITAATIVKGSVEHGPDFVANYETGRADQLRVITEGVAGARFRLGDGRWQQVGVYDVPVVDAAGAGDWTTAAMLHELARLPSLTVRCVAEAIDFGHSFAALNCAVPGARGLMEGRSCASVMGMATRLRRGDLRLPVATTRRPSGTIGGVCEWCLLPVPVSIADRASR